MMHFGTFEWGWTDWLGLVLLILVVAYVRIAFLAIRRGESPFQVFSALGQTIRAIGRRHSN
jgi:hypothetical protein